jgi:hypothetical protein
MAERKVSIREFVEWIILQIDPAVLSELMTAYGYTDDSVESVMNALEAKPEFVNSLAVAFREATESKRLERRRIVGGYQQVDEDMTFDDWMNILLSGKMELATGLDNATTETEKKKTDWVAILGGFAGVLGSFFGFNNNQNQNNQQYQQPVQQSGSTTFIWIILGVVVVSVIAIFAITLSKKK